MALQPGDYDRQVGIRCVGDAEEQPHAAPCLEMQGGFRCAQLDAGRCLEEAELGRVLTWPDFAVRTPEGEVG